MAWRENANITKLRVRDLDVWGTSNIALLGQGTTFYVDPTNGAATNGGLSKDDAVASIETAYGLCTSGAGDNIIVYSAGTTSAGTTSYLTAAITWSKHGITVIGMAAPTRMGGRARISTAATALAVLITVSGNNNAFYNIHVGNYGSDAAALGCVKVTGERNYFENCHILGGGHATPAGETGMYSLWLAAASENTFVGCTFGADTIVRSAANGEVVFSAACTRNRFFDCEIISASSTAGKGAINLSGASALGSHQIFKDCMFTNFKPNSADSALTVAVIGTSPASGLIILRNTFQTGWAAWDALDRVYVANGAADNAAGGKAVAAH